MSDINQEDIVDADFEDIVEMDNKSLKMGLSTIPNKPLTDIYDFDKIFDLKPDANDDLQKPDIDLEEEVNNLKLRADFLKEVRKKNFEPYEKIKNNYYLDGELVFKTKKSFFGKIKGGEASPNASPQTIKTLLSELPPVITDIEKDNPNFMNNFKDGLIMAVDEDDFDIDTLKVGLTCPKRKEMLKIIDEVKNRHSLKFGNDLDSSVDKEPTENMFKMHDTKDIPVDEDDLELASIGYDNELTDDDFDLELLALDYSDNPKSEIKSLPNLPDEPELEFYDIPALPAPENKEVYALASPEPDFDDVFNADNVDLGGETSTPKNDRDKEIFEGRETL